MDPKTSLCKFVPRKKNIYFTFYNLICQQRYTIHGNMMFTYKHTAEGINKFCKQNKRIYA